jgi:hypothetical protein
MIGFDPKLRIEERPTSEQIRLRVGLGEDAAARAAQIRKVELGRSLIGVFGRIDVHRLRIDVVVVGSRE